MNQYEEQTNDHQEMIAIIGMAGRFPGAMDIRQFWNNLKEAKESITFYTDEELLEAGISPEVLKRPDYIKAKGEVADVDLFDAGFFDINPREAEVTDPQHRMLLECAWEALEHAGYDSSKYDGRIGIFAGKSMDYYLLLNVYPQIKKEISSGSLQAAIGNDKDSLTTTVAYRLNLTGPAISVQTSSSTSLVSVCVACQSLLMYQCDIALAGGITAGPPIRSGYQFQEGGIWSKDGHCRAFDAESSGFVPGAGMGLAVLKRYDEALADGDFIWAAIKGFAVNNDGSTKVSYTAPSVDAQAEVIAEAQAVAGVGPDSIQYIEAHGTGTYLGDPIEMAALNEAFKAGTDKRQCCAIGSVKTNIGHLDNAAGVAGLIKTALALHHKKIPASLHFSKPNPKINFDDSPFFVNTQLREWTVNGTPRRAGVTSLGMGGTNAHVVLEEASQFVSAPSSRSTQLLLLSTKTASAMEEKTSQLAGWFQGNRDVDVANAAFTLAMGRRDFLHRRFAVVKDSEDAAESFANLTAGKVFDGQAPDTSSPVMFMFSGQGSQYAGMARELYQVEPGFKQDMDRCAGYLSPIMELDIRDILFPADDAVQESDNQLRQTWITQPLLFVVEYCLARLLMGWGIEPAGMIGHSIGEYVAACIAGSFELEDALKIVAARGKFMHAQAAGAMLSVPLPERELLELLPDGLELAAVNSPNRCVVSGPEDKIAEFETLLAEKQLFPRRLHTSHAFHSAMMEPAVKELEAVLAGVTIQAPQIPFVSCLTGQWIKPGEVMDPHYWGRQLRETVRFSNGIATIMKEAPVRLLEVGPGDALCVLAKERFPKEDPNPSKTFQSLKHAKQTEGDMAFLQKTLGQCWLNGVSIDWRAYFGNEKRRRVPMPTYPFQRKRYWLEVDSPVVETSAPVEPTKQPVQEERQAANIEEKAEAKKTFQPRPALANDYISAEDDIQKGIVAIWEDILGIKPIGVQDNFFDLGGHSLLATLFLSKIQDTFHIRLELGSIFESPTIETIARLVQEKLAEEESGGGLESILGEVEGMTGLEE
jgi:acyl transferase domain-containing protein